MPDVRVSRDNVLQDGAAIRQLRIQRGLRLVELAPMVRCHAKHLQHVERQERGASEVLIVRLADALGVQVSDISRQEVAA